MDISNILQDLEKYQNEDVDWQALASAIQTNFSSQKTPLGLNHWQPDDKPRMEQFNEDNRIIDEQLRELQATKADKEPVHWHYPTLLNGAENSTWSKVKYRKEGNTVYLEGCVLNAAIDKQLFVMPEGFRPYESLFICTEQGLASKETHPTARLQITPSGAVSIVAADNKQLLETMWVSVFCSYTAK